MIYGGSPIKDYGVKHSKRRGAKGCKMVQSGAILAILALKFIAFLVLEIGFLPSPKTSSGP